jgi:hypothetical protein
MIECFFVSLFVLPIDNYCRKDSKYFLITQKKLQEMNYVY